MKLDYLLTYNAEGSDDPSSRYFSGHLHWPGGASGVTIGHGFDFKEREEEDVRTILESANIPESWLTEACGLKGQAAQKFVEENKGRVTLNTDQMQSLFRVSYDEKERYTRYLATKDDVVDRYGYTDLENLSPQILTVLVDMTFRGDYVGKHRRVMQKFVVANDLQGFRDNLSNRDLWMGQFGVPRDRFERRVNYLEDGTC